MLASQSGNCFSSYQLQVVFFFMLYHVWHDLHTCTGRKLAHAVTKMWNERNFYSTTLQNWCCNRIQSWPVSRMK